VISGFEFAVWALRWIGFVVETAVREGATDALMKEKEQECDLNAFCGELISITGAIPLEQAMPFELPQVIAELIQSVSLG
jgi:hypothetical protein